MEDTDKMPFGKFKGTAMANVPAHYLLWLHNNGSTGVRKSFPNVFEYITECIDALKSEIK